MPQPVLSADQRAELEQAFPQRTGSQRMSDREIWSIARIGERLSGLPAEDYVRRMAIESDFRADAVSKGTQAIGALQIEPETAYRWGFSPEEMFDPRKAIIVSALVDNWHWSTDHVGKIPENLHRAYNAGVQSSLTPNEWRTRVRKIKENNDFSARFKRANQHPVVKRIFNKYDDAKASRTLTRSTQLNDAPTYLGRTNTTILFPNTEHANRSDATAFIDRVIEGDRVNRNVRSAMPGQEEQIQAKDGVLIRRGQTEALSAAEMLDVELDTFSESPTVFVPTGGEFDTSRRTQSGVARIGEDVSNALAGATDLAGQAIDTLQNIPGQVVDAGQRAFESVEGVFDDLSQPASDLFVGIGEGLSSLGPLASGDPIQDAIDTSLSQRQFRAQGDLNRFNSVDADIRGQGRATRLPQPQPAPVQIQPLTTPRQDNSIVQIGTNENGQPVYSSNVAPGFTTSGAGGGDQGQVAPVQTTTPRQDNAIIAEGFNAPTDISVGDVARGAVRTGEAAFRGGRGAVRHVGDVAEILGRTIGAVAEDALNLADRGVGAVRNTLDEADIAFSEELQRARNRERLRENQPVREIAVQGAPQRVQGVDANAGFGAEPLAAPESGNLNLTGGTGILPNLTRGEILTPPNTPLTNTRQNQRNNLAFSTSTGTDSAVSAETGELSSVEALSLNNNGSVNRPDPELNSQIRSSAANSAAILERLPGQGNISATVPEQRDPRQGVRNLDRFHTDQQPHREFLNRPLFTLDDQGNLIRINNPAPPQAAIPLDSSPDQGNQLNQQVETTTQSGVPYSQVTDSGGVDAPPDTSFRSSFTTSSQDTGREGIERFTTRRRRRSQDNAATRHMPITQSTSRRRSSRTRRMDRYAASLEEANSVSQRAIIQGALADGRTPLEAQTILNEAKSFAVLKYFNDRFDLVDMVEEMWDAVPAGAGSNGFA